MDISKIKPKNLKQSDKYSSNTYKLFKKISNERYSTVKVFWNPISRWDGEYLPFENKITSLVQVMICTGATPSTGYFLSDTLRKSNPERYAIPYDWKENMIDITDWFLTTYERIGRCIYSPHDGWLQDDEGRMTVINNTRRCNYCGEWEHKEIRKVTTVKRKEVWV